MLRREAEALQDEVLAREARRLAERQARDKARVQRFMDARGRTIGVDRTALAAQLEEKKQLEKLEAEAERAHAERAARANEALAAHEAREKAARQALVRSIREEWEQQAEAHRGRSKASLSRDFLEAGMTPGGCGKAALQRLDGEDDGCQARRQAQAAQQRDWVLAQLDEKAAARQAEAEREAAAVAEQAHIQALMARHASAEAAYRKALAEAVQAENAGRAARQQAAEAARERERRAEEQALVERLKRDPMLSEANDHVSATTGRIQVDRFKGFTRAQRAQVLADNAALRAAKARKAAEEHEAEAAWDRQQAAWAARLEELEAAEAAARRELEAATRAALEEQRAEHAKKVAKAKADAFGAISPDEGFFSKLGTSLA